MKDGDDLLLPTSIEIEGQKLTSMASHALSGVLGSNGSTRDYIDDGVENPFERILKARKVITQKMDQRSQPAKPNPEILVKTFG